MPECIKHRSSSLTPADREKIEAGERKRINEIGELVNTIFNEFTGFNFPTSSYYQIDANDPRANMKRHFSYTISPDEKQSLTVTNADFNDDVITFTRSAGSNDLAIEVSENENIGITDFSLRREYVTRTAVLMKENSGKWEVESASGADPLDKKRVRDMLAYGLISSNVQAAGYFLYEESRKRGFSSSKSSINPFFDPIFSPRPRIR